MCVRLWQSFSAVVNWKPEERITIYSEIHMVVREVSFLPPGYLFPLPSLSPVRSEGHHVET